jgi:hypothetical protein
VDPNKYKENANIRADTLLQTLSSVASMALMLIGIIGIAIDFFKEDSWITKTFAYFFQSTNTMLLIPVVIFVFWLLNRWISSPSKDKKKKTGNLPMYLMIIVGLYYLYQFIAG